jgi:hypothetical protein
MSTPGTPDCNVSAEKEKGREVILSWKKELKKFYLYRDVDLTARQHGATANKAKAFCFFFSKKKTFRLPIV